MVKIMEEKFMEWQRNKWKLEKRAYRAKNKREVTKTHE